MPLLLRLRSRLRRSSLAYWSIALAVAAVTGFTVANLTADTAARAAELGGLREVPVAARAVRAGHTLRPADVTVRRLPGAAVPAGPLASAASAVGRPALVDLAAGEVLMAAKVAPGTARGIAALLPAGMRALAVPTDAGGLNLEHGHHVDVLATFDVEPGIVATDASAGAPTFAVATGALVIDVAEEAVTVAVSPAEAPRVAFAMARGTVTLALTSPRSNWEE